MDESPFLPRREERYFEDYRVGSVQECGPIPVTEEEIIEFARRYDPQYFHTDPEAAKRSPFGGLIASGWHTAGLMMRLLVDNLISPVASLGSPGVKDLRWVKPVRPGDELSIRATIRGARLSRSRPDRGIVEFSVEVMNQERETVMTMESAGMYLRRPSG
ncbi:MAG: acyl dehydratase [Deltaproteobacteria bacterium]|nr:acyl dehydratase [Deltaproteobacteria bacterium]